MGDPLIDVDTIVGAYGAFGDISEAEQTRRIRAAGAAIEAYVGRPLGRDTYTETHRPEGTRRLYLRVSPVVSIASIAAGRPPVALDADAYEIADADAGVVELFRSYPGGYRYPDRAYGGDPRAGSVVVEYVAGYETADVPADIQQAAILAVMAGGSILGLNGGGLYASEQIGSYAYRLSATGGGGPTQAGMGLPPTAIGLVHRYRRIRLA